jgi:flagellar motor switch protein FliN/FliY
VADGGDLLDPSEIEALLKQADQLKPGGAGNPAPSAPPESAAPPPKSTASATPSPAAPSSAAPSTAAQSPAASAAATAAASHSGAGAEILTANDIAALFSARQAEATGPAATAARPTAKPVPKPAAPQPMGFDPESLLRTAEAGLTAALDTGFRKRTIPGGADARPFEFASLTPNMDPGAVASLSAINEVELDMHIELGRAELLVEEVLRLREGSVVPLDKLAGDPVDILVNGRLIARGEVLVLNDTFCVRVAEILAPPAA